jgi:hypothetical protein
MSFGCPDDLDVFMVDNNGQVLVAALVTRLVNSNRNKVIKAVAAPFSLKAVNCALYDGAYALLAHPQKLTCSRLGQVAGKSGAQLVKWFGKAGLMFSPRHPGCVYTMLWTHYSGKPHLDVCLSAAQILSSPTPLVIWLVVDLGLAPAMRAAPAAALVQFGAGNDAGLALLFYQIHRFQLCLLDAEQLFEYAFK